MFLFRKRCLVLTPSGARRDHFVCAIALSFLERLIGFCLPVAVQGIFFPRCRRLHGFGLKQTLQVIFLDADGVVLGVVHSLRPWGCASHRDACHAIELISPVSVVIGDRLVFEQIHAR